MTFYEVQRECEECGTPFWGNAGARCCSNACRARLWRKKKSWTESFELAEVCREVIERRKAESASWSKLLPRLFRATAAALRKRGWDPIELLLTMPDEPVSPDDTAPGGIEHDGARTRRWLHPPDQELALLDAAIAQREAEGRSTMWHRERREQLLRVLATRATADSLPTKKPATRPAAARRADERDATFVVAMPHVAIERERGESVHASKKRK